MAEARVGARVMGDGRLSPTTCKALGSVLSTADGNEAMTGLVC